MLKDELPELVGETEVDGKLHWMFSDGQTRPVVRGGSGEVEEEDDDDLDDDGDEDETDEDEEEGEDDEDEDEDDADLSLEEFSEDLLDRVESLLDARISKLTRSLDRKYSGNNSDRKGGRNRGRDDDDDRDRFSVREAKAAGNEIVREQLGRMTTAEREAARSLLDAEVRSQRASGEDDEEQAGEAAARAVVRRIKALRKDASRQNRRDGQRSGTTQTQRRPGKQSRGRTASKQMSAGQKRAREMFGTTTKKD